MLINWECVSIGQHLQPIVGNRDVSVWLRKKKEMEVQTKKQSIKLVISRYVFFFKIELPKHESLYVVPTRYDHTSYFLQK